MHSFAHAFRGILHAFKTESHLRFHFLAAAVLIPLAAFFGFERWEWVTLILTICIVISLEMVNTAVERTVDLITNEQHPLAQKAKDVAAGSVLLAAFFAIVTGIVLFYPYISRYWMGG